jgi:uncharacterized phage infection (PIP) family protein YhgE
MPSGDDFMNKLNDIWNKLNDISNTLTTKLDALKGSVDTVNGSVLQVNNSVQQVNGTLLTGFGSLVTIGNYTNQALYQNDKQNDTIICILEHISRNTCAILNEAHEQTGLQREIKDSASVLADLYATTHAEAMLDHERRAKLRRQIEECCPPPKPTPPCQYEPCPAPSPIGEPPRVTPPPQPPGPPR